MVSIPDYICDPMLPITITVFGCGGTGTQFLTYLARIAVAYRAVYEREIQVTVVDGDKVTRSNVGRQLFADNEIDQYKAEAFVTRINRFYGFRWIAINEHFEYHHKLDQEVKHKMMRTLGSNFLVTCTDTTSSRKQVKLFHNYCLKAGQSGNHEFMPYFWVDCGNTHRSGQVVVGSKKMGWPDVLEAYEQYYPEDIDEGPSCSLAMALNRQDLFINPMVASVASMWLRDCLFNEQIDYRGAFINLNTLQISKLKVYAKEACADSAEQQSQPQADIS